MLFQPPPLNSSSATLLRMSASPEDKPQHQASSRILYDIPCKVCTDHSSGKHYGIFACDGCAGFFKRSIRRNRQYVCKAKAEGACVVDKTHRNQCRACRLQRCINVGMNKDAVQHERGPRNSTLRRQMSLYFKDSASPGSPPKPTAQQLSSGSAPQPTPNLFSASSSAPSLLLPPAMPHYSAPFGRPSPPPNLPFLTSPPGFAAPPSFLADSLTKSYQLHLSFLQEARRNNGLLLMPTPKYPHEMSPSATPTPPVSIAASSESSINTPPSPFRLASENISEMAARLLFMNVKWAQHVPAFTSLPYRDQMLLLEESWRELFALSSAQFGLPVELAAAGVNSEAVLMELKSLQECIQKFQAMQVDPTEFACLRAIILLKTHIDNGENEARELRDQAAINNLQDQAQLTLSKYIATAYPNQPSRFGKLLLLLPNLKSISGKAIEELFFKKTIGAIPIERIICDMYKAGAV